MGALIFFMPFLLLLNVFIIGEAVYIYIRENFIRHNKISFWEVMKQI